MGPVYYPQKIVRILHGVIGYFTPFSDGVGQLLESIIHLGVFYQLFLLELYGFGTLRYHFSKRGLGCYLQFFL